MPKTVTLRIDDNSYEAFSKRAKAENRSLSNFIENAAKQQILQLEFSDDAEMAEILANEELVARLKRGSQQVKKRKGRMIG